MSKLNLSNSTTWAHHRSGWGYCMHCLRSLHNPYGLRVIDYVEKIVKERIDLNEPWVGFVHNTRRHPPDVVSRLYGPQHDLDLEKMVLTETWNNNLKSCQGLFCFCETNAEFLRSNTSVLISKIKHATEFPKVVFDWDRFLNNQDKRIVMIGHWLRNFDAFFALNSPFSKILLQAKGALNYHKVSIPNNVQLMGWISNHQYDDLLSENLVFLNLHASSANNTIVECMARYTPILINKLDSPMEYLGSDYPWFYETLDEATEKLKDLDSAKRAHEYLRETNLRAGISGDHFLQTVENSDVYKSLPVLKI